jgi:hypothetical protein
MLQERTEREESKMLLNTLFRPIRNLKDTKLFCRHCNYKTTSACAMFHHLHKHHGTKPSKRDVRFALAHSLASRIVQACLASLVLIPLLVLKLVCLPFYFLYEIL